MIQRLTNREHAMARKRLKETNKRIATLEERIQKLTEEGKPIVDAERLLRLTRQSRASTMGSCWLKAKADSQH
jgi:hypothetical protein